MAYESIRLDPILKCRTNHEYLLGFPYGISQQLGREDQGERAGVTAGKNMDGLIALVQDVIRANGLTDVHMMKSQVGPSFGNNFNNRKEEAIGTAVDIWTAFREGAFGEAPRPFVAWLMLVEDAPQSRSPVRDTSAAVLHPLQTYGRN